MFDFKDIIVYFCTINTFATVLAHNDVLKQHQLNATGLNNKLSIVKTVKNISKLRTFLCSYVSQHHTVEGNSLRRYPQGTVTLVSCSGTNNF